MPRKRRVPKPVCRHCKAAFDPNSDKPKDWCKCPIADAMCGTYRVLNDKGVPEERTYGIAQENSE